MNVPFLTTLPTLKLSMKTVQVHLIIWTTLVLRQIIASAGTHQTCLPRWRQESSAQVYARYVSSVMLWGSKDKIFLGHFWLTILYKTTSTSIFDKDIFLHFCRPKFQNNVFEKATANCTQLRFLS